MIPTRTALLPVLAALGMGLTGTALMARPGGAGWGGPGWDGPGWDGPGWPDHPASRSSGVREGKVDVARFVADGAAGLGKGALAVVEAPAGSGTVSAREQATYQAAVIDALARSGYDTATTDPAGGQIAEVRVLHAVAAPAELPHKPVSGEVMMGVSNRGSMMGMGINIDMTKPLKALVSTRLEARIRDRASGAVLWEGRADTITREGDPHWTDQKIAAKLAQALFDGFPGRPGEQIAAR